MKFITEILSDILTKGAKLAGYDKKLTVTTCDLQELGDYQCTDAMSLAKVYHKSPVIIAKDIISQTQDKIIKAINVAGAGYINIKIDEDFLTNYIVEYVNNLDNLASSRISPKNTIIDYGGANVAKPLHVGHLRSANIGESIKRICKYVGNNTLGDVHLGDWGLQMGMVILGIKREKPELVYFDENFVGEYPKDSPVTISDLERIYPSISKETKENEKTLKEAKDITYALQHGHKGYFALWKHIVDTSIKDLKINYDSLNVHFDLWLGESDTRGDYDNVIDYFVKNNYAYESEGALVVDVKEENDSKEIPPFMLKKSDGSVLYSTTDLATLIERHKKYNAEKVVYVVDNRQELHFASLFRVAKKYNLVPRNMELVFAGFGTMNGKDGKPYKTRDGGVMKLKNLIEEVKNSAKEKSNENDTSNIVAISALKFADLSIMRTKDYIFDPEKFCAFEGKTGPYLLYSLTRAKSILRKVGEISGKFNANFCDKKILLSLASFGSTIISAYENLAPNELCDYAYKLANDFNSFYAKTSIINEKDMDKKYSLCMQTKFVVTILEKILNLLAIETLDRM